MSDAEAIRKYLEWRWQHEGRERDVSPEAWEHHQAIREVVRQADNAYTALYHDEDFDTADLEYALKEYWRTYPDATNASGAITGSE